MESTPEVDPLTEITVVGGHPTTEQSAAAVAVVAGMLVEGGEVDAPAATDRWEKTVRSGRDVAQRGVVAWDEFTGQ